MTLILIPSYAFSYSMADLDFSVLQASIAYGTEGGTPVLSWENVIHENTLIIDWGNSRLEVNPNAAAEWEATFMAPTAGYYNSSFEAQINYHLIADASAGSGAGYLFSFVMFLDNATTSQHIEPTGWDNDWIGMAESWGDDPHEDIVGPGVNINTISSWGGLWFNEGDMGRFRIHFYVLRQCRSLEQSIGPRTGHHGSSRFRSRGACSIEKEI